MNEVKEYTYKKTYIAMDERHHQTGCKNRFSGPFNQQDSIYESAYRKRPGFGTHQYSTIIF